MHAISICKNNQGRESNMQNESMLYSGIFSLKNFMINDTLRRNEWISFHFRECYVYDEKKGSSIRVRNTRVDQIYMELIVPELFRKSAQS